MKRLLIAFLALIVVSLPVSADEIIKFKAEIMNNLCVDTIDEDISFKLITPLSVADIELPEGTIISAHIYQTQEEKRFHKSGYFRCTFDTYNSGEDTINISDKNIRFIGKPYEPIDKVDAAVTTVELSATTVAGFIIPGSDIVYYFTKGAIQRNKDINWFRSGVSNAYDNSILWVFEKGKCLNLKEGDFVTLATFKDKEKKKKESE